MPITAITPVSSLLAEHPGAREVLAWHGVDPGHVDTRMSVSALCWLHRIDEARLLRDLAAVARDGGPLTEHDLWGDMAI